jgi:elongation factor Ts
MSEISKKEIGVDLIKALREKTSASVMECKRALQEAEGDEDKAMAILKKRGIALAQKKAGRATKEGAISSYVHTGDKLGVLVEVNCETDFVARTPEFKELVSELAMQIAASDPKYIETSGIPAELLEEAKSKFVKEIEASGISQLDKEKLLDDKMKIYFAEVCLFDQPFIKDPAITIRELVQSKIAKFGENITIGRYIRFKLGEA